MKCERCGVETDVIIGCSVCGQIICPGCESASSDQDEPVCEDCFVG